MSNKIIKIAITDPLSSSNTVSVEILIRTLESFQNVVYALGASKENYPFPTKRIRYSTELKKRYTVQCGIPIPGSYATVNEIIDYNEQPDIQSSFGIEEEVFNFLQAIEQDNPNKVDELFTNPALKEYALRESEDLLPKSGKQYAIDFTIGDSASIHLDSKNQKTIKKWIQKDDNEESIMTVIGLLIKVFFEERSLIIKHPVTNKEIKCTYDPEIEETILSSKRDYIQVTGTVTIDEEGNPKNLSDVSRIQPIDLSDIVISYVEDDNLKLHIDPPLTIKPELDEESKQLYTATNEELRIFLFAYTREDLVEELESECLTLWYNFVKDDPKSLSLDAIDLRKALLKRFKEIKYG